MSLPAPSTVLQPASVPRKPTAKNAASSGAKIRFIMVNLLSLSAHDSDHRLVRLFGTTHVGAEATSAGANPRPVELSRPQPTRGRVEQRQTRRRLDRRSAHRHSFRG